MVARRQRQPVVVANGVDDADLGVQVEVANKLLDDGDLLRVLPPEPGDLRAHDVQQLETNGGDAPKVLRPLRRLEAFGRARRLDPRCEPGRVQLLRAGREQDVDPFGFRMGGVTLGITRIRLEIGALRELRRVDEQRGDQHVAFGSRGPEERAVPCVQRTHRRHEPHDSVPREIEVGDRADDLHERVTSTSASYAGSNPEPRSASRWRSTVSQSPRAIGPVSSKPFSIVRSQQWHERLGRDAGGLEEPGRGAIQRDEEVRGDRRACVVERSVVVGEREAAQAERLARARSPGRRASSSLAGHRSPGAVELLGAARADERLQRVHREAAHVRVERGERVPPETWAIHGPGSIDRATSPIARSGTQRSRSSPLSRTSMPRSRSRAAIAEPARPAPMTVTVLNMWRSSSLRIPGTDSLADSVRPGREDGPLLGSVTCRFTTTSA